MEENSEDKKSILGIHITDSWIKISEVTLQDKVPHIESLSQVKLNPDIIRKGVIIKPPQFQKALQKTLTSAHPKPFVSKQVIVSLPESSVYTYVANSSKKWTDEEVFQITNTQIKKLFDEDANQFYTISRIVKKEKKYRLYIAITRKKPLELLLEELRIARLHVLGIEPESFGLARSLFRHSTVTDPTIIIDVQDRTSGIYGFDKHGYALSTVFPVGGDLIDRLMDNPNQSSVEQAKNLMVQKGVKPSSYIKESFNKVTELLRKLFQEIKNAFLYYKNTYQVELREVIINGNLNKRSNFKERVQQKFAGKNVRFSNTIADHAPLKRTEVEPFHTAIGLAMKVFGTKEKLEEVNFIHSIKQKEEEQQMSKQNTFGKLKSIFQKEELEDKKSKDKEKEGIPVTLKVTEKRQKERGKVLKTFTLDVGRFVLKAFVVIFTVSFVIFLSYEILKKYKGTTGSQGDESSNPRSSVLVSEPFSVSLHQDDSNDFDFQVEKKAVKRTLTFDVTGKKASSDTVKGIIEIINTTGIVYDLDATTRLAAPSGKVYTMDTDLLVLYNSKADVAVTAAGPGESYELEKGTKLTFLGLSSDLSDQVYAVAKKEFTLADITIVAKKDIENARKKLKTKLQNTTFDDLKIKEDPEKLFLNEILGMDILSINFNAKAGSEVLTFKGTVKAEATLLNFNKSQMLEYASNLLSNQLNRSERLEDYTITDVELQLDEYIQEVGSVSLIIQFTAIRNK